MKKIILPALSLLLFTACSAIDRGPMQVVTLETPGAENALCVLHNPDFKYNIVTGETRNIMKSEYPLNVDCAAPGNRNVSLIIEPEVEPASRYNILNFGIGTIYDRYDNSLFRYPRTIFVDFTQTLPKSYGLPGYHTADIPPPDTMNIPHAGPTVPKVESDLTKSPTPLLKKETPLPAPTGTTSDRLTRENNPELFDPGYYDK